ncbi:MAG: L-threonylcarbamoyladenylate synthase [bacterium]|nr:L-threonylcarbamoyladenylate synthase [bacterium]
MNSNNAATALSRGGVLLLQTDTLPGLHCRADNGIAIKRIQEIKGRTQGKPMLILAGSLNQALQYCSSLDAWQENICRQCWPGPFSLILPAASGTPAAVVAAEGSVAIRVPDFPELQDLVLQAGGALASTSSNRQGQTPHLNMNEAWHHFQNEVDGLWKSKTDIAIHSQASALVNLCGDEPQILRPGPFSLPG